MGRIKFHAATISHLGPLIEIITRTNGNVLEMGIGMGSTPVLHELCRGRKLISYENDLNIYNLFNEFKTDWHEINFIDDWAKASIEVPWNVAFIDHAPASRRRFDIARIKDFADYVIVHDTEPDVDRFYRYRGAFSVYKYRRDYTIIKPYTTILSNKYVL